MTPLEFDVSSWSARCASAQSLIKYPRSSVSAPCEFVLRERWRNAADLDQFSALAAPVDVFVFAQGESPERSATKIGGLPYRPAGLKWPHMEDYLPWTFLAQFNFSQSRDLFRDVSLPGDVMLIFTRNARYIHSGPPECLRFEWYDLGIEELISDDQVYRMGDVFSCHGYRHRSLDYPWMPDLRNALLECLPKGCYGARNEYRNELNLRSFGCWDGVKIGGIPFRNENAFAAGDPKRDRRFLCTLTDVVPPFHLSFPWINQMEPSPMGMMTREVGFLVADGFRAHFFIDSDGVVTWDGKLT